MMIPYETEPFLNFCLPSANSTKVLVDSAISSQFGSVTNMFGRIIGDLNVAWPIILACGAGSFLLAFVYVMLMTVLASVLIWGAILLILASGGGLSYLLLTTSWNTPASSAGTNALAMLIAGYAAGGVTFVFFCVVVFLRKRIQIAIQVVKEASHAIRDMPGMQFFPFIPAIFAAVYVGYWVVEALFIFSVQTSKDIPLELILRINPRPGGLTLPNPRKEVSLDDRMQPYFAYHFFHLLWSLDFLVYWAYLVIAGAVADWYFTPFDRNGQKPRGSKEGQLTSTPVLASIWRSLKHVGTVSVAALIVAIIQFIRAVVSYMQAKAANMNEKNPVTRFIRSCVFCLIQCCLKCLECCLDKINKNGLIMTAITGENFCFATCSAFRLVWSNLARVAAISVVGSVLVSIGQFMTAIFSSAACAAILLYFSPYKESVSSITLPCALVFIIAYCIGSVFLCIFDAAIDTIFMCFLLDEEKNMEGGRMLASKELQDIINAHAAESKEIAEKRKSTTPS